MQNVLDDDGVPSGIVTVHVQLVGGGDGGRGSRPSRLSQLTGEYGDGGGSDGEGGGGEGGGGGSGHSGRTLSEKPPNKKLRPVVQQSVIA